MGAHIREIDGLRAIAVLLVLVTHWMPSLVMEIPVGRFGVLLFFVISGFLITGILLGCREKSADLSWSIYAFYARRFLRIFPPYYLVLALSALLIAGAAGRSLLAHVVYASNILFAIKGVWGSAFDHIWSLAVEEQFYLIWPFVILFSPRRVIGPAVVALIVAGPAFRAIMVGLDANAIATRVLLPGCLDTLALGALLAVLQCRGLEIAGGVLSALGVVGAVGLTATCIVGLRSDDAAFVLIWQDTFVGLASFAVLAAVTQWNSHTAFALLRWKPAAQLGVISYGVYLYHGLTSALLHQVGLHGLLHAAMAFPLTLGVAFVSWRYFELPISQHKRRFPYLKPMPDNVQLQTAA